MDKAWASIDLSPSFSFLYYETIESSLKFLKIDEQNKISNEQDIRVETVNQHWMQAFESPSKQLGTVLQNFTQYWRYWLFFINEEKKIN